MIREVSAGFTLNELLAHLEESSEGLADGFYTSGEWSEHFGLSYDSMMRLLREAKRAGRLRVAKAQRERVDGVAQLVSVYAFDLEAEEGATHAALKTASPVQDAGARK
jgi:hypothetical protein